VLITGASSGIGRSLARHYARAGRPLVLVARNADRLQETAAELVALTQQAPVVTLSCDVSDAASVQEKMGECVQTCGVPDLVINAAGIVNVGRFVDMTPDYYDRNVRVDLDGTVNVCRFFAPLMIERRSGHIVNVSSAAGFLGIYGYTGYSAAKFAVMGFSEALRFELRPHGVSVSVVCPPDTETPGLAAERAERPVETEVIAGNIKALDPDVVAAKIVKGIARKRFYIIIGATTKFYFRLKGLLPEIFLAIVDSDVARAGKQRSAT